MKDKAKMSLNWVNVEVDENAFENDAKERNRKKNKKKIRKKLEKMIKQNWWDKLLSWPLYDEDFVKEQFQSVLLERKFEGTRALR